MSQAYLQEFGARNGTAIAEGPDWLEPVRRAAIDRFAATGFPTARDEEWRFTPVGPIAQGAWRHLLFGAVLGELERRLNPPDSEPSPIDPAAAASNGHGSAEYVVSLN